MGLLKFIIKSHVGIIIRRLQYSSSNFTSPVAQRWSTLFSVIRYRIFTKFDETYNTFFATLPRVSSFSTRLERFKVKAGGNESNQQRGRKVKRSLEINVFKLDTSREDGTNKSISFFFPFLYTFLFPLSRGIFELISNDLDEARTVNFSTKALSFTIAARHAYKSPVSEADTRKTGAARSNHPRWTEKWILRRTCRSYDRKQPEISSNFERARFRISSKHLLRICIEDPN